MGGARGTREGTWNAGRVGTGAGEGERVGSPAPASRAGGAARRAGGVPRGRGAAPARRRPRPLPDSRPPRVHSDFSAHFSSSPVTPALALPPPAAPPRSASRGNPPPQPAPGARSRALRRSAPAPTPPGPLRPYSRRVTPKSVTPLMDCPLEHPQEVPSLGVSSGAGDLRDSGQVFSTSGPQSQNPLDTQKPGM